MSTGSSSEVWDWGSPEEAGSPPKISSYTTSKIFSRNFLKYADALASGSYPENLRRAIDIENGKIINPEIRRFREERDLFCE